MQVLCGVPKPSMVVISSALVHHRQREARLLTRRPLTTHRASATLPLVAPLLGAGQPHLLPQGVKERGAHVQREPLFAAVDGQGHLGSMAGGLLVVLG